MRILFCNIAYMKYYKGIIKNVDEPRFGGEYVLRTGDAFEKYNFTPYNSQNGETCYGFFETKSTNGKDSNQLHIEKIEGISNNDELAENVLVVWCAKYHDNRTVVVGWYKNATVYRYYDRFDVSLQNNVSYTHTFNIVADAEDCVLLSEGERNVHIWQVPRKNMTRSYGFGQANVWFASEESAANYKQKIVNQIENFEGENWLRKHPIQK